MPPEPFGSTMIWVGEAASRRRPLQRDGAPLCCAPFGGDVCRAAPLVASAESFLKKLSRSTSRSIGRLLRHLTGESIVSATLTLSIPPFIKLELGFKQEIKQHGAA